jgi:hypothetical protein
MCNTWVENEIITTNPALAQFRGPVTPEDKVRQARPSQDSLRTGICTQSIAVFAPSAGPLNSAPKAPSGAHHEPQNAKTTKVKTRNEVNLTSDKYGARIPKDKPHVTIDSCSRAAVPGIY